MNAVAPGPVDDDFYRAAETPESIAAATRVSGQTVRANGAMF